MYIDLLIPSRQDFPQNYILQFSPDDLKRECFLESHVQKNPQLLSSASIGIDRQAREAYMTIFLLCNLLASPGCFHDVRKADLHFGVDVGMNTAAHPFITIPRCPIS